MNNEMIPASVFPAPVASARKPGPSRLEGCSAHVSFEQRFSEQQEKAQADNSRLAKPAPAAGAAASDAVVAEAAFPSAAPARVRTPGGSHVSGKPTDHPMPGASRAQGKGDSQPAVADAPAQPLLVGIPFLAVVLVPPQLPPASAPGEDAGFALAGISAASTAGQSGISDLSLAGQAAVAVASQPGAPASAAAPVAADLQSDQASPTRLPGTGFSVAQVPPQAVPVQAAASAAASSAPAIADGPDQPALTRSQSAPFTAGGAAPLVAASARSAAPDSAVSPAVPSASPSPAQPQPDLNAVPPAAGAPLPPVAAVQMAASASTGASPVVHQSVSAPAAQIIRRSTADASAAASGAENAAEASSAQPPVKAPTAAQTVPEVSLSPSGAQPAVPLAPPPAGAAAQTLVQQVENRIESALQQGRRSLRLQLNPKVLGGIEVRLVSTGQLLSVTLTADKATTGSLLEKQVEELRASLANAGIQQVTVNVSGQASSNHQGSDFTAGSNPQHHTQGGNDKELSENESEPTPRLPQAAQDARIDYRI